MIILDYKDSRPIYEQIVEKFSTLILRGVIVKDSQMPSVRSLAMELSVNPNTIQKAYSELERNGFIYVIKGRGAFVAAKDSLLEIHHKECLDELKRNVTQALEYGLSSKEIMEAVNSALEITANQEDNK